MTHTKTACLATILAALLSGAGAAPLPAQTDYYNTDAGAARIRRSAAVELLVATLVLAVTAVLVATPTGTGIE